MSRSTRHEDDEKKPTVEVHTSPIDEQAVLAAAIRDAEARAYLLDRVPTEHFLVPMYRAAWAAMLEIRRRGLPFSPDVLATVAGEQVKVDQLRELAQLRPDVPEQTALDHHVERVRWLAYRASLTIGPVTVFLDGLRKPSTTIEELLAATDALRAAVTSAPRGAGSAGGILSEAMVGAEAHEAAADKPLTFVWQDRVAPGNVALIGGLPGAGKTTAFAMLIAARCNRKGEPVSVLGGEVTPADPHKWVVFVEGEMGETSTARLLRHARRMLGLPEDTFAKLVTLARKEVMVGSPRWLEIVEMCRRGEVDSIWIDSLARFQAEDANSEQQAAVFAELQRAIEAAPGVEKPCGWMLCHSRKSGKNGGGGDDITDIAGSVQRAGQADVVAIVTADKDDDGQTIRATMRFAKIRETGDDWPRATSFAIDKTSGPAWVLTWGGGESAKENTDEQLSEDRVFDLLKSQGQKTKQQLRTTLKMSGETLEGAITTLFKERRIKKSPRGKVRIGGKLCDVFVARADKDDVFESMPTANGEGGAEVSPARGRRRRTRDNGQVDLPLEENAPELSK